MHTTCLATFKAAVAYISRTREVALDSKFRVGLHHDGASYNGEDTLVSVAYLPAVGIALLLPFIAMPRVVPIEDCNVNHDVRQLLRERRLNGQCPVRVSFVT